MTFIGDGLYMEGVWCATSLPHLEAWKSWEPATTTLTLHICIPQLYPKEEAATKIFANSAEQAETYAILKAIFDMEWRSASLIIKSDNTKVITALKCDNGTNKNLDNIVRDINRLANSFMFVSCIKVSREEVKLEHNLAIKARKS